MNKIQSVSIAESLQRIQLQFHPRLTSIPYPLCPKPWTYPEAAALLWNMLVIFHYLHNSVSDVSQVSYLHDSGFSNQAIHFFMMHHA